MHDNPLLDERTKQLALEAYGSDLWRRAREFGDFVDVGGLIYPDFDRCVRAQANGMTVLSELNKEGIYPNLGQNDHELGFGQLRARMEHGRFKVADGQACAGLRAEADDYAAKDPKDGTDDSVMEPVRGNDHELDALRYAVLERFWDPVMEDTALDRNLGWEPGRALPASQIRPKQQQTPMGSMS
jgi:hypothetical protein